MERSLYSSLQNHLKRPRKLNSLAFLLITTCSLLISCGEKRNGVDRKAIVEEMQNREVKKVSEAEITKAAFLKGRKIADESQKAIFLALQKRLTDSFETALSYCSNKAYSITDSLSTLHGVSIRRVSFKTRNKKNNPNELEKVLLDSYEYSVENKLPLDENVQEIDEQFLLYTKPITISQRECLRCHGSIGTDISTSDYERIKKIYPQDEATGYKPGDFRGMWSIKLSKKELIKEL